MRKEFLRNILDQLGGARDISFDISDEDISLIENAFDLNDYNEVYQLRYIRNYVILIITKACELGELDIREYGFLSNIIANVIDRRIRILL